MRLALLIAVLVSPVAALAQGAPRYAPARDTLRYEYDNPFRLYWMRGADTVGHPGRYLGVELHAWRGTDARPEVVIRDVGLTVDRRTRVDSFTLSPRGRVLLVNDSAISGRVRMDLVVTLPTVPLAAGTRWSDTVAAHHPGIVGEDAYSVARAYRVERIVDTLGTRVADIAAQGTVRYRLSFWTDSAARKSAWSDLTGPVRERFLFDVGRGRMLHREWDMDLRGRGVAPDGGPDTVPAGLRSRKRLRASASPRLRFLLEPLPGADTSATVDVASGGVLLLHTVRRGAATVSSSLSRNDGMVGVASATFAKDARLDRYEATWSDSSALVTQRIRRQNDALLVSSTGRADTTVGVPAGRWGVADYAMQELLVPVLVRVPRDGRAEPFAVFRPFARRWDVGLVSAEERAGLVAITIRWEGKPDAEALLLTPEGDYLFGENAGPLRARRVPANQSRVRRLMEAINRRT